MELAVQHQGRYSDFVGGDVGAYYQSYSGYKVPRSTGLTSGIRVVID
jgi:hypothetical protein